MAIEKTPNRAAAARYSPLPHRHDNLIKCSVRLLANQSQKSFGMILQNRPATPARLRSSHTVIVPRLQPFHCRTGTDLKALGGLAPRRPRFYCPNYSLTQITGIRFRHRAAPSEPMPIDSLI